MTNSVPHSTAGEPLVDADHPWLGLLPFREKHHRFFFGRDHEIADLFERVTRHPLTVLFGPSGLGKTSLLNAGLCPRLRDSGWIPVLIRLRYPGRDGSSATAKPPALLDQIAAEVSSALEAVGHAVPDPLRQPGLPALWPLFHDTTAGLYGAGSPRLVLVLDQFEEIFTLGEDEARARDDAARLRDALADLVENRPPPALARQLEFEPGTAARFDFDAATCHVTLVVREDYLARLERWSRAMPSLLRNRMELRLLDGPRAFDAVVRPARLDGRDLVSDEVGAAIVRAVAGKGDDKPLDEISAVPPFLSLLCAQLNERRIGPRIEGDLLFASREHILQSFYTGCFAHLPGGVRETIEDLLLSPAGFRESPSADTVHATLFQRGVVQPVASLRALEDARLITSEERGGIRRIELTHDVLTKPVSDSRNDRHAREKSEQLERERLEAEARTAIRQERIERTEGLINYLLNSLPMQVPPTSLGGLFTELDRYYSSLGADEREAKEALSNRAVLAFNIGAARKNHEDAKGALQYLQEAANIWGRLGDADQKNRAEREIREVLTLGDRPLRPDTEALSGTFDIFVCYSRRDNRDGIITALVRELERIHRAVTGRDLIVFLDKVSISSGVIWEQCIRQALSKSRMFMVCMSPSYFQSEECRKQLECFLAREVASSPSGEGIVPILCWDVPEISGGAPGSQMTPMMTELRRRQFIDLRPLFHEGISALRQVEVQRSLNSLVRQVVSVRDRFAVPSSSPTTIPPFNRRFVGRREELAKLRRQLINSRTGTIVVLHGLGGTGKTEVAFAYAHAFATGYPGGRFLVPCKSRKSLCRAVAFALDGVFHGEISDEQRKIPELHFGAVRDALRRQAEAMGNILLVLDDISEPALLNPSEIATVSTLLEKVNLLATTRLAPGDFRAVSDGIVWVALGALPSSDALELFRTHRPVASDEESAAAAEIVNHLGGFPLAVESVAAFLGQNRDITYSAMLERLKIEGSEALDFLADDAVVQLRHHNGERRFSAVLPPTLATLSPIERTALEYASLFAPDYVAVPWLRTLSDRHFSELQKPQAPGHPDPWQQAINKLLGLGLLSRGADERDEPRIVRCHKLVQEIVRSGLTDEPARWRDFYTLARIRSAELEKTTNWQETVWELPVLDALAQRLAEQRQEPASLLLNAGWQHDLSANHVKMGDALRAQGDLAGALKSYRQALDIIQRLAAADPSNANWQRDLSVSHIKLGDALSAQGDLPSALKAYRQALDTSQRLADAEPSNAGWQRDLSVSHIKLGDALRAQGDLAGALKFFRQACNISQRLAAADPSNADWQSDLSVSQSKLGDVLRAQGDLVGALKSYRQACNISQRLAAADPSNADWQHDLSVSHNKLGVVLGAQGDLAGALKAYRQALEICQRLADADPSNAGWQRDLSVSHVKLGDVLTAQGDLAGALKTYRQSLDIRQRLADGDPSNANWQRDLSASQDRFGDVLRAQGDLAGALKAYRQSLIVIQRLAAADPSNAGWQLDLSVSYEKLGDVLRAQDDLVGALKTYRQSLDIRQRHADADPSNAAWQRDLSVSHEKLGDVLRAQGALAGALETYRQSLDIIQRLTDADPSNADWQRDLVVSCWKLATLAEKAARDEAALWWRKGYETLSHMKQRGIMRPTDEPLLVQLRLKAGQ